MDMQHKAHPRGKSLQLPSRDQQLLWWAGSETRRGLVVVAAQRGVLRSARSPDAKSEHAALLLGCCAADRDSGSRAFWGTSAQTLLAVLCCFLTWGWPSSRT